MSVGDLHDFRRSLAGVAKFLDREGDLEVESIRRAWSESVGEALADHTNPTRIERHVLVVAADSPAARAAVSLASQKIIAELVRRGFSVGEVRAELRSKSSQRR